MKSRFYVFVLSAFVACNPTQSPYLKHKMIEWKKTSGGCETYNAKFKMESTLIGERYEFQKCLDETYDGQYTAERKGDTVELRFASTAGPKVLYNLTMDIDAYPRYHYLTIDGTTFAIVPVQN